MPSMPDAYRRKQVGRIAARVRANPDDPSIERIRAEMLEADRRDIARLVEQIGTLTPEEIRPLAYVARKIDRRRKVQSEGAA